ncbi:hypothetical protein Glove_360g170 [Diversispora epigaea]|uniref:Uncharacterized protein n=1 Tax=Diversispora epigaea TaxID=1348612 RepID=A0A397HF07_9GLOM|nr:hypothetical protein Glove_360g170 [Diversispora epigaea]
MEENYILFNEECEELIEQKNNSNENDENLQINQQQNMNKVVIEKLNIQKQMNDELEREITLLEKRK